MHTNPTIPIESFNWLVMLSWRLIATNLTVPNMSVQVSGIITLRFLNGILITLDSWVRYEYGLIITRLTRCYYWFGS
jgi:hypothetical protein